MTVRDYVLLDHFKSPFLNRLAPTDADLKLFLWMLSPTCEKWIDRKGRLAAGAQHLASYFYARKIHRKFCRNIPESSEAIALKCFDYVDLMMADRPGGKPAKQESTVCYLGSWFGAIQREHHLPTEEIWRMPLPVLFARLREIISKEDPDAQPGNWQTDEIKSAIARGLAAGKFSYDDLAAGRVKFDFSTRRVTFSTN